MLVADLRFYPDSRTADGMLELGRLILNAKNGRGKVGFIESQDFPQAADAVEDPTLSAILGDLRGFLQKLGAGALEGSEEALAQAVVGGLPYNVSMTVPHEPEPVEIEEILDSVAVAEAEDRRPVFAAV